MATMVMNGVKTIDTIIPDITKEEAKREAKSIAKTVGSAAMCAGASIWLSAMAITDASWLVARTSKTVVKEAGMTMKEAYFNNATTITIRR